MPKTDDLSLIVLKGHLLIEERLFGLAELALPHPQYLKRIRNLPFSTLAYFVRAAVREKSNHACWELIPALNSLRNDYAHKLEPPDLQKHLQKLFQIDRRIETYPTQPVDKSPSSGLTDAERLRYVIIDCMTFLSTLEFDYSKRQSVTVLRAIK